MDLNFVLSNFPPVTATLKKKKMKVTIYNHAYNVSALAPFYLDQIKV